MTPVGHTLTGLAIGYAICPRTLSPRAKAATLGAFVLLAIAPDLPFPGWGHSRYDISHSVFVTGAGVAAVVAVLRLWPRSRRLMTPAILMGVGAAWFSHLLLDTFYGHGKGLAMFWPLSEARIALPIKCFEIMGRHPLLSLHNLRIYAIEGAIYGTLLLLTIMVRNRVGRKS